MADDDDTGTETGIDWDKTINECLATLRERWPGWEVWHVPCAVDPDAWSARRWGRPIAEVTTRSPAALDVAIAGRVAER